MFRNIDRLVAMHAGYVTILMTLEARPTDTWERRPEGAMGTTLERPSRGRMRGALRLATLASGAAALLLVLAACGSAEPAATPQPTPTATAAPSAPAKK